jgi:hypothetical protein
MATRCRDAWSECPKGRLVRRYARQSGSKIEFKLAADVLVLVRYWKSGEKCEQLTDVLVKVTELNARVKESNVSRERCHLATGDGLALFKELSISMDNLESKLFTVIEERSASMSEMRIIIIIIIIKFVTNVKQYNTTVYDMCDRNKEQNFHPNYYLIPLTMY